MQDYKKQILDDETNKNAEKRKLAGQPVGPPVEEKGRSSKEDDMVHSLKMNKALSIVERMVNQNAEDEIFQDFKFWEDVSQEWKDVTRRSTIQCMPILTLLSHRAMVKISNYLF